MPKIKILANWSARMQKEFNIPKGFLVIQYKRIYREALGKVLLELNKYQESKYLALKGKGEVFEEGDYLRDLEIDIEYHYRKRTIDQNALMWELYDIEANELNGGKSGAKDQTVTKDELYLGDLNDYGEHDIITTRRKNYSYFMEEYKIIEAVVIDNKEYSVQAFLQMELPDEYPITLHVIRGSSKFNTKEMSIWIDRQFNRLAYNGVQVTNPGQIKAYWHKWRQYINDQRIVIHDSILTQQEYKALNPICEGCGEFIGNGTGHLHHIKTIGMGGDRTKEPFKNYASNWLHFCVTCHIEDWHKVNYKAFLKDHKWLTYKVLTALNRNYSPIVLTEDEKSLSDDAEITKNEKAIEYVDPGPQDTEKRVYYHPESCSLFVDVYPLQVKSNDDGLLVELARVSEKVRIKDIVLDMLVKEAISKKDACLVFEEIGLDPLEIDPAWIGIF